ncbi:MAG: 3-phosphoshikimate 1-carboxyvinyltransferase, partial [Sphingobacteriia bacterium]
MVETIVPGKVNGTIPAPPSKSSMQRACAAALLHQGETILSRPGKADDDLAALSVIQALGAKVDALPDGRLRIISQGVHPQTKVLDCGESGLGIRMFTPLAALSDQALTIQGRGSLVKRPMDFFDEVLPQLGVGVSTQGGKLPLEVKGPLQARSIQIDGSMSSQFLTGLLMAFATTANTDVVIEVNDLKSKPYIDLTLSVLAHFGWEVVHENHARFRFQARKPQPEQINY